MTFEHPLIDDPEMLGTFEGWDKGVYQDFFRVQRGEMDEAAFRDKYVRVRAVLTIDMTGYTFSAIHHGEVQSFMRIMNRVDAPDREDDLFAGLR